MTSKYWDRATVQHCAKCGRWHADNEPYKCVPLSEPRAPLAARDEFVASAILNEASALVGGDRARTHGDKAKNMGAIAAVWNGYLQARKLTGQCEDLDGHDVANLMELMKVARRLTGSFNRDDYVDGAGYAGVAGEVKAGEVAK